MSNVQFDPESAGAEHPPTLKKWAGQISRIRREESMRLELKGDDAVILKLSFVDSAVRVVLLAAETNGLWIKAEDLYERLPGLLGRTGEGRAGQSTTPTALFVPFTHVQYVLLAPPAAP